MSSSVKKIMFFITALTSMVSIKEVEADCRKTFIYHPRYNYGYEIFCIKTTNTELSSTMAMNEISLTIDNSDVTISSSTFRYLKKIRILNITNSNLHFDFPPKDLNNFNTSGSEVNILSTLEKLEILIIENTNITPISMEDSYLQGLSKLKTLILDNSQIHGFPNGIFNNLQNLKVLSLKNNGIKSFESLNICSPTSPNLNLRQLDLSNNAIGELKNSQIMCFKQLETLNMNGNFISKLHGILSTSLTTLTLSSNKIDFVDMITASKLTTLDLSFNNLSNITIEYFKELKSLTSLNLSHNNLTSVHLNNKMLKDLDLSYNKLKQIPNCGLPQLELLNLNFNNLSVISNQNFSKLKNLETLMLANNNLHFIDNNTVLNMTKLQVLNMNGNSLRNISLTFTINSTLNSLNINNNLLENLTKDLFTNLRQLKDLDVSFNKLRKLNVTTFEKLENLEILNMSYNLLTELDYKLLEPLENLVILDVDNNLLKELDYGSIVSELPNLNEIKAKNNLLSCNFLTKMIHYFKENDITFSLHEHLDYDKENVEGIYCKETEDKLLDLQKAEEVLLNNTKALSDLNKIINGISARTSSSEDNNENYSLSGGEIAGSAVALICLVVLIILAAQNAIKWHRRRNYLVDELELISHEPYKRLG